jgi:predicted PurR-regulated permease PerM
MKILKQEVRQRGDGVIIKNFPGYFLILCLVLSFIFLFKVLQPFLTYLILAAVLATAFYPVYSRILRLFKNRSRLASVATCFLILFLIIVPLLIFILLLGKQAYDTYNFIQHHLQNGFLDPFIKWEKGGVVYDWLSTIRSQVGPVIDIESIDLKKNITDVARTVTSFLATQSASVLKGFGGLLLGFFIMFFALYYFFKDAKIIIKKVMILSPLPKEYEIELIKKFKQISLASLYGIFLTSIAQGIVGGIGFAIAGIPSPIFWGTAIAFFSLVPVIGTSIVWLPASLILLASGNVVGGIFVFFWGLLLVSTVDNFLRAFLIGGRTNTNPLLTFLAVFGGLGMFGLVGVIFGPMILTLFFSFAHIYELEYDKVLHGKEKIDSRHEF